MKRWFRRRRTVPLERQLAEFARLGVVPRPGVTLEDVLASIGRSEEELETAPYRPLADALSLPPFGDPNCNRLWMCDYECIEGHGSYERLFERLQLLTNDALPATNVTDRVFQQECDVEDHAWLEFDLRGERVRWDIEVEHDWLDPSVLERYGAALASASTDMRLWESAQPNSYGQYSLLAGLTTKGAARFTKLTGIALELCAGS